MPRTLPCTSVVAFVVGYTDSATAVLRSRRGQARPPHRRRLREIRHIGAADVPALPRLFTFKQDRTRVYRQTFNVLPRSPLVVGRRMRRAPEERLNRPAVSPDADAAGAMLSKSHSTGSSAHSFVFVRAQSVFLRVVPSCKRECVGCRYQHCAFRFHVEHRWHWRPHGVEVDDVRHLPCECPVYTRRRLRRLRVLYLLLDVLRLWLTGVSAAKRAETGLGALSGAELVISA